MLHTTMHADREWCMQLFTGVCMRTAARTAGYFTNCLIQAIHELPRKKQAIHELTIPQIAGNMYKYLAKFHGLKLLNY